MSNIWRLNKGDKVLEAENFYLDDCPMVKITLDPLKTPQQNAAKYYKDYNKAKAAQEHLGVLILKNEMELQAEAYARVKVAEFSVRYGWETEEIE